MRLLGFAFEIPKPKIPNNMALSEPYTRCDSSLVAVLCLESREAEVIRVYADVHETVVEHFGEGYLRHNQKVQEAEYARPMHIVIVKKVQPDLGLTGLQGIHTEMTSIVFGIGVHKRIVNCLEHLL